MGRAFYPGGSYADAHPSGARAVLTQDGVDTHQGLIPYDDGTLPLYVRIFPEPFQFAGQASNRFGTMHYHDGAWHLDPRISHGTSGCIFDQQGVLHCIPPAEGQTSQGYRYVADDGTLVLGDATLLANGLSEWSMAGDLQIGQGHAGGGVKVWDGSVLRVLDEGSCRFIRVQRDGDAVAVSYVKPEGAVIWQTTLSELRALPPVAWTPPPVTVPRIGRPLWLWWFTWGKTDAPRNATFPIGGARAFIIALDGTVIAQYASAEEAGTPEALDEAIHNAQVINKGVPVLPYWPSKLQTIRVPKGSELVGIEAYRLLGEPLGVLYARVVAACRLCAPRRVHLICRAATTNQALDPDVAALVPVYAQIAIDCPNVEGLGFFSAGANDTHQGYEAHPEAHAAWRALFDGISGTPALPTAPVPRPPAPVPPPPHPPPIHPPVPPTPNPPPHARLEGDFLMTAVFKDPLKTILVAKELRPKPGTSNVTAIAPDGQVYSIDAAGGVSFKPDNWDGGHETCRQNGNLLVYHPDGDGRYQIFGFVLVDGL